MDALAKDLEDLPEADAFMHTIFLISVIVEVHVSNAESLRKLAKRPLIDLDDGKHRIDHLNDRSPVNGRHNVAVKITSGSWVSLACESHQFLESREIVQLVRVLHSDLHLAGQLTKQQSDSEVSAQVGDLGAETLFLGTGVDSDRSSHCLVKGLPTRCGGHAVGELETDHLCVARLGVHLEQNPQRFFDVGFSTCVCKLTRTESFLHLEKEISTRVRPLEPYRLVVINKVLIIVHTFVQQNLINCIFCFLVIAGFSQIQF